jgi:tetratricopeptide (TPR) repeat protein
LPAERIEQVRKMIASENWQLHPERDLSVAYIFWTNRAKSAFEAKKYQQAQQLATRSLEMHPIQPRALEVLARAQFAQADFAGAATSYRKLLDLDSSNVQAANAYAQALAAADRHTAITEFRQWTNSIKGEAPPELQVLIAGLSLLAGDASNARNAVTYANANTGKDWAPDWLGPLGWWYYEAGDHSTALDLLSNAVQLRPGSIDYTTQRAWVQIEDRKLADALQSLNPVYGYGSVRPDRRMARATAFWVSQQHEEALREFEAAVNDQPEWNNARWVQALYSPLVAQSVRDMQSESERRRKAQLARGR